MILDAFWSISGGDLVIYVRKKYRGHIVKDVVYPSISPYFFVDRALPGLSGKNVERKVARTIQGKWVDKIEVFYPSEVKKLREKYIKKGIQTYESNIPFVMRWMIDENIPYADFSNPLYFDIEVDWRRGLPHPIEGKNRILGISWVDRKGNGGVIVDRDEYTILTEFVNLARHYDCLVGYNIIDFDVPVLKKRMELFDIKYRFGQLFDLYRILSKVQNETITNRLDDVASMYLGVGKTEIFKSGEMMFRAFLFNRKRFEEYAFRDAELCLKLDEKFGLLEQFVELMQLTKLRMEDLIFPKKIVEAFILKKFYEQNPRTVLPYVGKGRKTEKYAGAIVFEPVRGLHERVAVFDFTSLYNRVMQTFNICMSTIGGDIKTEKLTFSSKKRGILPQILIELEDLRNHYKKLKEKYLQAGDMEMARVYDIKQYAMKRILLSVYGYVGHENSPFYMQDLAESVTLTGRRLITYVADYWRKRGYVIVGGDTDSFFIKLHRNDWLEELKEIEQISNDVLHDFVIEHYNVPESFYRLKLHSEKVFDRLFYLKKKNYIGRLMWEDGVFVDKTLVRGLPLKKLNTPPFLRNFMKQIFDLILQDKSYDEIRPIIDEWRNKLYSGLLDRDLVITMVLSKDPDRVKSNQPYYRVAKNLKKAGLFRPGDPVSFVWVTDSDVAGVVNGVIPTINVRGYAKYWEMATKFLIEVFGKNVVNGVRSLEGFLSVHDA